MKYQTDEALREILRRGEQIAVRRERRTIRALAGATGALFMALVLAIGFGAHRVSSNRFQSVYGSFLLSPEAGGYVLAAVIAFALGVTVTLLCIRRRLSATHKFDERPPRKGDGA